MHTIKQLIERARLVPEFVRQSREVSQPHMAYMGGWLGFDNLGSYSVGTKLFRSSRLFLTVAGYLVLIPAWLSIVLLLQHAGPAYVLLLMLLVWGADIGAYFSGRRFGRNKLAPRVSPGKTWEGLIGALLVSIIISLVAFEFLEISSILHTNLLILCLVMVLISILGDLVESMFKRMADVKDSGGLLPGHGGVLDRIDSLTAAAPVFTLGLYLLGVIA